MRLVAAEFLRLRGRTGLVLATLGLTLVPALVMLAVTGEDGGLRTFNSHFAVIALLTVVGGILVGATVGTADESSGVFRDLVVTGRSRIDLFAARVPAGLTLVLAAALAGFVLLAVEALLSSGSVPTRGDELGTLAPPAGLLLLSAGWLALVAVVSYTLALGVSSVVGSPGAAIATLLAFWLVLTPAVQSLAGLAWLRDGLVVTGLDRLMPDGLQPGELEEPLSLAAALVVLAAWMALPMLAGAWRTATRDA